jgi:hypothetical protein
MHASCYLDNLLFLSFTSSQIFFTKSRPLEIDAINKIVALIIWMDIDLIVNQQSIALRKPSKDQRSLQHVDVIVEAGHAKKSTKSIDLVMPRP